MYRYWFIVVDIELSEKKFGKKWERETFICRIMTCNIPLPEHFLQNAANHFLTIFLSVYIFFGSLNKENTRWKINWFFAKKENSRKQKQNFGCLSICEKVLRSILQICLQLKCHHEFPHSKNQYFWPQKSTQNFYVLSSRWLFLSFKLTF